MWFRLALSQFATPLAALVGSDGNIYWRILDIAKLLGIQNTYQFAKRYGDGKRGDDVVTTCQQQLSSRASLRCLVLDTQRAAELLMHKNYALGQDFCHALQNGKGMVIAEIRPSCKSPKYAPLFMVNENEQQTDVSVAEWIETYVNQVQCERTTSTAENHETAAEAEPTTSSQAMEDLLETEETSTLIPKDGTTPPQIRLVPTQIYESRTNEWVIRIQGKDAEKHTQPPSVVWITNGSTMYGAYTCAARIQSIVGDRLLKE